MRGDAGNFLKSAAGLSGNRDQPHVIVPMISYPEWRSSELILAEPRLPAAWFRKMPGIGAFLLHARGGGYAVSVAQVYALIERFFTDGISAIGICAPDR